MKKNIESKKSKFIGGFFAGGGLIAATFAVVGASCCLLPLVLINLGLSSAVIGNLSLFSAAKPYFTAVSIGLVGLSFFAVYRNGRRPSGAMICLLIIASLFTILASLLPFFEGSIVRWIEV